VSAVHCGKYRFRPDRVKTARLGSAETLNQISPYTSPCALLDMEGQAGGPCPQSVRTPAPHPPLVGSGAMPNQIHSEIARRGVHHRVGQRVPVITKRTAVPRHTQLHAVTPVTSKPPQGQLIGNGLGTHPQRPGKAWFRVHRWARGGGLTRLHSEQLGISRAPLALWCPRFAQLGFGSLNDGHSTTASRKPF
jgi:hypothetical protein